MSVTQVLTDDQDKSVIQPGALCIHATFTVSGGGISATNGEVDFGSFANLIAYAQALQKQLNAP